MAAHSSVFAWEIPWIEEPGGLQSLGSQRVRHDLATKPQQGTQKDFTSVMWRKKTEKSLLNTYIIRVLWVGIDGETGIIIFHRFGKVAWACKVEKWKIY